MAKRKYDRVPLLEINVFFFQNEKDTNNPIKHTLRLHSTLSSESTCIFHVCVHTTMYNEEEKYEASVKIHTEIQISIPTLQN